MRRLLIVSLSIFECTTSTDLDFQKILTLTINYIKLHTSYIYIIKLINIFKRQYTEV